MNTTADKNQFKKAITWLTKVLKGHKYPYTAVQMYFAGKEVAITAVTRSGMRARVALPLNSTVDSGDEVTAVVDLKQLGGAVRGTVSTKETRLATPRAGSESIIVGHVHLPRILDQRAAAAWIFQHRSYRRREGAFVDMRLLLERVHPFISTEEGYEARHGAFVDHEYVYATDGRTLIRGLCPGASDRLGRGVLSEEFVRSAMLCPVPLDINMTSVNARERRRVASNAWSEGKEGYTLQAPVNPDDVVWDFPDCAPIIPQEREASFGFDPAHLKWVKDHSKPLTRPAVRFSFDPHAPLETALTLALFDMSSGKKAYEESLPLEWKYFADRWEENVSVAVPLLLKCTAGLDAAYFRFNSSHGPVVITDDKGLNYDELRIVMPVRADFTG